MSLFVFHPRLGSAVAFALTIPIPKFNKNYFMGFSPFPFTFRASLITPLQPASSSLKHYGYSNEKSF